MALMRSTLLTGSLFAAATLGSACVVSVDSQAQIVREEKRFTVSGTPELRLTTFDGAIEIQSWDKPDVAIDIEKRGSTKEAVDGLEIVSSQTGNRIELEVKRPRSETLQGFGFQVGASAKLIVTAGNCPWWLITSGCNARSMVVTAESGTCAPFAPGT